MIRISDIPGEFAAVLTGHIHRRQILKGSLGNVPLPVIYAGSIERTSFAEKDEPKGFYEIEIAPDESGNWQARPMVDLLIDGQADSPTLLDLLRREAEALDPNSIVRLRCAGRPGRSVLAELTAASLRSVFPSTMNVQLGLEIRNGDV